MELSYSNNGYIKQWTMIQKLLKICSILSQAIASADGVFVCFYQPDTAVPPTRILLADKTKACEFTNFTKCT